MFLMTPMGRNQQKKLTLKESYALLTRGLDWEPSYQKKEDIYRTVHFEGIKIHDWDKWEDPFRLTMDAYWKYQGEKEKKLYAIIDAFQQNNGQFNVTDARYVQALKVFINGVVELEYASHRGFCILGREFPGAGPCIAAQMQSIDELRHATTQIHVPVGQRAQFVDVVFRPLLFGSVPVVLHHVDVHGSATFAHCTFGSGAPHALSVNGIVVLHHCSISGGPGALTP